MTISNKPVVTVAGVMTALFMLVGWYETQFFLLHFFEALIYLVIILLFFYLEDRFGYILGILVPAVWIVLNTATGLVPIGLRELWRVAHIRAPGNPVGLLAGLIFLFGFLLMQLCWHALRREIVGTPYLRSTLLVGAGITMGYYGILILWFLRSFRPTLP